MTSPVWANCVATLMSINNARPEPRKAPPRATKGSTVPLWVKMNHDDIRRIVALSKKGKTPKYISTETGIGYNQVTTIIYNARSGRLDGHVDFEQ